MKNRERPEASTVSAYAKNKLTLDETLGALCRRQTLLCAFDLARDFGLGLVLFLQPRREDGSGEVGVYRDVVEDQLRSQRLGQSCVWRGKGLYPCGQHD